MKRTVYFTAIVACVSLVAQEKKAGVVRVGVIAPTTQLGPGNVGEPLKALMIQHWNGPAVEFVPVTAIQQLQVAAEAVARECDYLIYTTFTQKKTGAGGGLAMLRGASSMASMIPMVGAVAGMGGMIAGQAANVALSSASVASGTVKAKNEVTLDYKLLPAGGGKPVLENVLKARAKEDGEDVITPLIDQAGTALLGQLTQKAK